MARIPPLSIPDVAEVREGLAAWLERRRRPVLGVLAASVAAALGLLIWTTVRQERMDEIYRDYNAIVDTGINRDRRLFETDFSPRVAEAKSQVKDLEALRERARGTELEPIILFQIGLRSQIAGEDDRAVAAIEELERDFRDAPILRVPSFLSEREYLAASVAAKGRKRREFASKSAYAPPKPDLARYALVETALGDMKIVFYPGLAPKHVEEFVARAKAGAFNGTRAYGLHPGEWIEIGGGDRTRNEDPADDGEDDPAESMAPEDGAMLGVRHARRTVTAVPLLSGEQASRFAVILAEKKPEFDALRTPFGELLDDASVQTAEALGSAMTYGRYATYQGRPEASSYLHTPVKGAPVLVRRVSIWKEGALEDGHSWDTSKVGEKQ